jgi:hypothetical protein
VLRLALDDDADDDDASSVGGIRGSGSEAVGCEACARRRAVRRSDRGGRTPRPPAWPSGRPPAHSHSAPSRSSTHRRSARRIVSSLRRRRWKRRWVRTNLFRGLVCALHQVDRHDLECGVVLERGDDDALGARRVAHAVDLTEGWVRGRAEKRATARRERARSARAHQSHRIACRSSPSTCTRVLACIVDRRWSSKRKPPRWRRGDAPTVCRRWQGVYARCARARLSSAYLQRSSHCGGGRGGRTEVECR